MVIFETQTRYAPVIRPTIFQFAFCSLDFLLLLHRKRDV